MKCNHWVIYRVTPKGKRRVWARSTNPDAAKWMLENGSRSKSTVLLPPELCGGKIIASVDIEETPFFGGVSHDLDIRYKCERCGADSFPDLSDQPEWVSEILTAAIAAIPEGGQPAETA